MRKKKLNTKVISIERSLKAFVEQSLLGKMQVCGTFKEKETLFAYFLCQENGDEIKLYILNSLNQLELELNNVSLEYFIT